MGHKTCTVCNKLMKAYLAECDDISKQIFVSFDGNKDKVQHYENAISFEKGEKKLRNCSLS